MFKNCLALSAICCGFLYVLNAYKDLERELAIAKVECLVYKTCIESIAEKVNQKTDNEKKG